MPLLKFDLIKGKSPQEVTKILDAVHEAVVEAFEVPVSDRYQVVYQHEPENLFIDDTGLGFTRTQDFILISITSNKRTDEKKVKLYQLICENLEQKCNINPMDIMINITENTNSDWSFGNGIAQFISGDL